MTKIEYVKSHIYDATISQISSFLSKRGIEIDYKWKKDDYVKNALPLLNDDSVTEFAETSEMTMISQDVEQILGLSQYYIRQLVKTNRLRILGTYKTTTHYGYGNLYSVNDVFDCVGLIQPKKRKVIDVLSGMPKIMEYYPTARKLHRKFYIHVGGTNTGKTYSSLMALKQSNKGVYLGPLRLLAIEIYEQLNEEHYPCSLLTGEEENIIKDAPFEARTVEKVDINTHYQTAIIDECQMLDDPNRGSSWTRAILGTCADEIHAIVAPEGLDILIQLINLCNDEYEIIQHERKVPLVVEKQPFQQVKDHDALIVFSRKAVLSLASELEREGIPVSIIYGSLPYSVRIKEAEKFRTGVTKVVVSTDAIGMGLNLPIERIVFMESQKYDGICRRPLQTTEIKQIAGRAGRYGMYNIGYVSYISTAYKHKVLNEQITKIPSQNKTAIMPFPEELLKKSNTYGSLLNAWTKKAVVPAPFVKKDVSREIELNSIILQYHFDNSTSYKLCTIPFDEKNRDLKLLWINLIDRMYHEKNILESYPDCAYLLEMSLDALETLYKEIDLFYSFSKTMNYDIESEKIQKDRENISLQIMHILKEKKTTFIKKCVSCGKELPWNTSYTYCESCYRKMRTKYDDFDEYDDFDFLQHNKYSFLNHHLPY